MLFNFGLRSSLLLIFFVHGMVFALAWKAVVMRFPGQNLSLVTLINTGKADPLRQTRQMADVVLGLQSEKEAFATQPAETGDFVAVEDILGTYLKERNFSFRFVELEKELYLKRVGRNDIK